MFYLLLCFLDFFFVRINIFSRGDRFSKGKRRWGAQILILFSKGGTNA
jgi:hypothetical protein